MVFGLKILVSEIWNEAKIYSLNYQILSNSELPFCSFFR